MPTITVQLYCKGTVNTRYGPDAGVYKFSDNLAAALKILGARTVNGRKLPNGDPRLLGATIQTWRQGFVQPLSNVLKCTML